MIPNYRLPEYSLLSLPEANQWYYEQGKISKKTRDYYNQRTEIVKQLSIESLDKANELKEIPFYDIDYKINHEKIKEELLGVMHMKQDIKRGATKGWFCISLYDIIEKTKDCVTLHSGKKENFKIDYHDDGSRVWKITDAGKKCPYIIDTIFKMTDTPMRIQFRSLPPDSVIRWHTHLRLPQMASTVNESELYHEFPVHIPVITNKYVYMMVGDTEEHIFQKEDHSIRKFIGRHIPVGKIVGFNAAKNHQVWNGGETERWHVFFYANFIKYDKNPQFRRFL